MKKQKQLSPRKYIETKARTLPIYKCWVSPNWKEAGIADVIVARQHTNGNLTTGFYLVDLMCLGIKECFYSFNEPEDAVISRLLVGGDDFIEISYELAHNIVFAGRDFALDYEIQPHKEFAVAKYILEEDTDAIPLIEIPTGDEEGKPSLFVSPEYDYKPVLEKLRKNAGEGNYTFTIVDDDDDWDDDDLDGYDDEEDDDNGSWLDEIEHDYLDFNHVSEASDEALEEASDDPGRSVGDLNVIQAEQLLRHFDQREAGWTKEKDEITGSEEYKLLLEKFPLYQQEFERSTESLEKLTDEINVIIDQGRDILLDQEAYFRMFLKYEQEEMPAFSVLNTIPSFVVVLKLEVLRGRLKELPPLVQLLIAGFSLAFQEKTFQEEFGYITRARTVEDVFPGNTNLHVMHHKIFWAVKALSAMNGDEKEQIQHYHSLVSVTGIGGRLKLAYAMRLAKWFEEHL